MSQPTIEAYGFDLPLINKPTNLQEFIDLFTAEKTFDYADKYRTYHIIANGARDAVLDAIEKVTGIKPKMRTVTSTAKDGSTSTSEVQDEGDGKYVSRALAEALASRKEDGSPVYENLDAVRSKVSAEMSQVVVDYTKEPERRGGAKKAGVNLLKRAQGIFDKGLEGVTKTLTALTGYLPESYHPKDVVAGPDGVTPVEGIAKWLAAFDKFEEAEKARKEAALSGGGLPAAA